MKLFEKKLMIAVLNKKTFNSTNIKKLQENALKWFQSYPEHVVLQTDKNLGRCVMSRENFINQCIAHNLSNEKYYERIDENAAQEHTIRITDEFLDYVKNPSLKLPCEDFKCLNQEN